MGFFKDVFGAIRDTLSGKKADEDAKPDPERRLQTIPHPFSTPPLVESRMLNDDGVYAVYMLFKQMLLGAGFTFEGDDAKGVSDITDAITAAPGFAQLLDSLAAAPFQRFTAAEIVWNTDNGWLPEEYRVLPNESTSVDLNEYQKVDLVRVTTTAGLQELPTQNAVVFRYRHTFAHPMGTSFYDHLKEVIDYKRRTDTALVRYIERFAAPSIIGWYGQGMSAKDQRELFKALQTFQSASVGVLPGTQGKEGNSVQLLEAEGSGAGIGIAVQMLGNYERRIARAVLGAVLAMFESQYGTQAATTVHLDVLLAVIMGYQADIEEPVNKQVVTPTMTYNKGAGKDVRFKLKPPSFRDLAKLAQVIQDLAAAGFLDPETDAEQVRNLFGLDTTPKTVKALAEEPEPDPATAPTAKTGDATNDDPQEED